MKKKRRVQGPGGSSSEDPPPNRTVVDLINRQRKCRVPLSSIHRLTHQAMNALRKNGWEVCVTFVSEAHVRRLNREYRGIDRPTDVLSFPEPEGDALGQDGSIGLLGHLGDVVIAPKVAERYARRMGIPLGREIHLLVLHGLIHLCGYDHETDEGEMDRLERKLRRRLLGQS